MKKPPSTVLVTRTFEANLASIEVFLIDAGCPDLFPRLLDALFDTVIPNLERFPRMGTDLLARRPLSVEGLDRFEALRARLGKGAMVRQYVLDDYLVLYLEEGAVVHLLAIKHRRQLRYDLVDSP